MRRVPLAIALCLALSSGRAATAGAANSCALGARADFTACHAGCKSELADDLAVCRGHDPICAQTCADGRDECTKPIVQANLTNCVDQCDAPLDAARTTCKAQVSCGGGGNPCGFNPAYITCIDPAQAAAFACRDTCRDAFALNTAAQDALKACKSAFKTCVEACPPPAP